MRNRICLLSAMGLFLAGAEVGAQASTHELRGSRVAIYNIAGVVQVEAGTGSAVQVEVTRRGRDAGQLRVESGSLRQRETLRVIYPGDRIVYRGPESSRWGRMRTSLRVADDGTFDGGWDGSRGDRVEVRSDGEGLEASADLRVRVPRGTSLELHLAVGEATVSNMEGDLLIDVHAARVTTNGTRGRLDLDTGSGEVSVTNAEGEVTLDTGSGSVTLEGIRGPSLVLDTGSGRVSGDRVEVRELRLDTGSGRVALRGVQAPDVFLDTGSGSVEIDLAADVDRLSVDSGSGGVTIGVPSTLGAELSIETGSGGIDVDVPVTMRRAGRRSFEGQLGDGRGRMGIETGSGGVRIRAAR